MKRIFAQSVSYGTALRHKCDLSSTVPRTEYILDTCLRLLSVLQANGGWEDYWNNVQ